MTMNTMTRFSEFFESKLNKLITSPTGPARRAFLALALALTVGSAWAQGIVGSLITGKEITKHTVFTPEGSSVDISSELQSFYSSLALSADQNVFVWLYTSCDEQGTFSEDQGKITFTGTGVGSWTNWGKYGYIYFGNAFTNDFLNLTATINTSGYGVTMLVTKDPQPNIAGDWIVDQNAYNYFRYGSDTNSSEFALVAYQGQVSVDAYNMGNAERVAALSGHKLTFTATSLTSGNYTHTITSDATRKIWSDNGEGTITGCSGIDWNITYDSDGDLCIEFASGFTFPAAFDSGGDFNEARQYKIKYLSDSKMILSRLNVNRYIEIAFTRESPQAFDYSSDDNLLKGTPATLMRWYAPTNYVMEAEGIETGWNTPITIPQSVKVNMPNESTNQWDAQFTYGNIPVSLSSDKYYNFSVKINLNQAAKVTLKLQDQDDDNSYLFQTPQVNLAAGDNVFTAYNLPGQDFEKIRVLFDFGGNGADLVATISDPFLKASTLGERAFILGDNTRWEGQYTTIDYANMPRIGSNYVETSMIATQVNAGVTIIGADAPISETVKGLDLKYMRWYLADTDGKILADQSPLTVTVDGVNSVKYDSDDIYKNYGQYWSSATAKSFGNLSITLGEGTWEGYSIVGVLSTEEYTNTATTKKEPEWDAKVEIKLLQNDLVSDLTKVPVIHKTLIYTPGTRKIASPQLIANYFEVTEATQSSRKVLADKGYVRWFLAEKGNEKTTVLPMDNFEAGVSTYTALGQYGYAQYKFDMDKLVPQGTPNKDYDPVVRLANNYDYNKVSLVCLVSTQTDGFTTPIIKDPDKLDVMYIYDLITEDDYAARPFIHYHGESWNNATTNHEKEQRDYTVKSSAVTQYSWDSSTGEYSQVEKDIRQTVHTVEYDLYLNLNTGEEASLRLPFQNYLTGGNNTEPAAYARWYDWNTDLGSDCLVAVGNRLNSYVRGGENRGLIALRNQDPNHEKIGVNFKVPDGFMSSTNPIDIACDISRYDDGIDSEGTHLFHEPTLGVRYLFHIYPASVISSAITTATGTNWSGGKPNLTATSGAQSAFKLYEDNGRVAVSLNGTEGKGSFSLRLNLPDINDYYIGENSAPCTSFKWVVYYYNETDHKWYYKPMIMSKTLTDAFNKSKAFDRGTMRIGTYNLEDFSNETGATFKAVDDDSELNGGTFTATAGMTFHVVSMLSDGTNEMPVSHYELSFIDAKPLTITEVASDDSRDEEKLREKFPLGGSPLTFDELFCEDRDNPDATEYAQPTSPSNNYAKTPLDWADAQYGFVYPQLYGQNATSKFNRGGWRGFGIAPLHGDYILLKSMNVPNVSPSDLYDATDDELTYHALWFNRKPLYDVTYAKTNSKYGTFLYVDAAEESRTIATLHFEATGLCEGTEVHYTAYVADMTDGPNDDQYFMATPPQVMFKLYAIDEDATTEADRRKQVVSFLSGDIGTVVTGDARNWNANDGTNDTYRGQWYQLYGKVLIPGGLDLPYKVDANGNALPTKYEVAVENYAINTDGADYAVDQIAFYCSHMNLKVEQESQYCLDSKLDAKFYLRADNLQQSIGVGTKTIYYRICDEENKPIVGKGIYYDTTIDESGHYVSTINNDENAAYGSFLVNTENYTTAVLVNKDDTGNGVVGYFQDGSDYYFRVAWNKYPLTANTHYYMSFFTVGGNPSTPSSGEWGSRSNPCSVASDFFMPKFIYVSLTDDSGESIEDKEADCSGWLKEDLTATMMLPSKNPEDSKFYAYNGLDYDFFIGSMDDYNNAKDGSLTLNDALTAYRSAYTSGSGLNEAYKATDPDGYALLRQYVDNGKLWLVDNNKFEYEFVSEGLYNFVVIPVQKYVNLDDPNNIQTSVNDPNNSSYAFICYPLSISMNYKTNNPVLELGFDDVTYPTKEGYTRRVVRMGLEQYDNLTKADGFLLHVPVSSFEAKSGKITVRGDGNLRLYGTNDPTFSKDAENVLTTQPVIATFEGQEISDSYKYISLNFHGTGTEKQTLHEGYEYNVVFQYQDSEDNSTCISDMYFLLKIVPEYVTWTKTGDSDNDNWLNDENWTRSSKTELYSTTYKDNTEINASLTPTPATYVPMKFTYVTVPQGNRAPKLTEYAQQANATATTTAGKVGLVADTYTSDGSSATRFIEYDMLARYSETTCQGGYTGHSVVGGNIYDCEKFYGNVCNEIYFKPEAELVNQQYLTYNRAWVEKELAAAKWSLMATPLQNTYSGDMYVPSVTGKQATEAFKDISFNTTDYSRTLYPIYQRSWGEDFNSNVYVATNDTYRSDFTANLPFTAVSTDMAEWSHTFNDVNVAYTDRTGFAIRAHKEGTGTARIRLPKADTSYSYYSWNGTETTPKTGAASATLTKANANKFVTDVVTDGTTDGAVTINVGSLQKVGDYVLVGNPYMASLKMSEFFKGNTGITATSYQTYSNGAVTTAASTGVIRPLQAFFVQVPSDVTSLNFTKAMMIDGNHETDVNPTSDGGGARRYMSISAANEHGSSAANVRIDTQASDGFVVNEDVETLFDSNLAEVPMVYTVAGQQAVSIDVRPAFELLPFGVVCAANNEPVSVTFNEAELLGAPLYVVDGATGEATPVNSGDAYEVQPNDYGRYFLSTRGDLTAIERTEVMNGIVISVRGRQVTVHAPSAIESVRAITTNGIAAYSTTVGTTDTSFTLNANGIYIIEAQTADTIKTVKVVVK